jgi:hypothetical protein
LPLLLAAGHAAAAMLVEREEFYDVYRAVQADGAEAPVSVLVSSADCDAVCAFRTLRALFKADNIAFGVFPVAGYEDVQREAARLAELAQDGKARWRARGKGVARERWGQKRAALLALS